jgi:hypothetical protein
VHPACPADSKRLASGQWQSQRTLSRSSGGRRLAWSQAYGSLVDLWSGRVEPPTFRFRGPAFRSSPNAAWSCDPYATITPSTSTGQ